MSFMGHYLPITLRFWCYYVPLFKVLSSKTKINWTYIPRITIKPVHVAWRYRNMVHWGFGIRTKGGLGIRTVSLLVRIPRPLVAKNSKIAFSQLLSLGNRTCTDTETLVYYWFWNGLSGVENIVSCSLLYFLDYIQGCLLPDSTGPWLWMGSIGETIDNEWRHYCGASLVTMTLA